MDCIAQRVLGICHPRHIISFLNKNLFFLFISSIPWLEQGNARYTMILNQKGDFKKWHIDSLGVGVVRASNLGQGVQPMPFPQLGLWKILVDISCGVFQLFSCANRYLYLFFVFFFRRTVIWGLKFEWPIISTNEKNYCSHPTSMHPCFNQSQQTWWIQCLET